MARLTLETLKVRDAERPSPLYLVRRPVPLSITDDNWVPRSSCIIEPDPQGKEDLEAERTEVAEAEQQAIDLVG